MSWRVFAQRCDRCLFGPDPLVSSERRAEILYECRREGRSFECHRATTMRGEHITCRAFYDQPDRLLPDAAQVAKRLHESGLMPAAVVFCDEAELDYAEMLA